MHIKASLWLPWRENGAAGDRGSRRELKEVIGEVVWVNNNGGLDHSIDQ